jgi:hypothetical protein
MRLAEVAQSLQGIGYEARRHNPVKNMLLWIVGICVTCGIGCIVANAVLWWRTYVKRSPGASWWTRI